MTLNPFAPLEKLPRVRLAHLPTPIDPLPNLSRYLGGPEISVKRDDQTGLATGGNKARKLEFLLAQAIDAEADCVITAGSTQSNHARQTAAGAAHCGLECHLVLYTPGGQPPEAWNGNVLLDALLGATLHWTAERSPYLRTMTQVEAELRAMGKRPYVIPYGGSNAYGMIGYVMGMREYAAQARALGPFDVHVFPTSSGGTQAGMLLGAYMAGLKGRTRILGISVDRPAANFMPDIIALAKGGADLLGIRWVPEPSDVEINDQYIGGGYAVIGDAEREAIRLMARLEGILVDPVYTGRALAGLIDLIRRGEFRSDQRVLFWHTGGAAALFAFAAELGL